MYFSCLEKCQSGEFNLKKELQRQMLALSREEKTAISK
jgi:hypothetical protein